MTTESNLDDRACQFAADTQRGSIEFAGWRESLPAGWSLLPLRRCIKKIEQGWSPLAEARRAEPGEWAVLKLSAVCGGHFLADEHKALEPGTVPERRYEVQSEDVLVTRANTPELVGEACFVEKPPQNLMLSDLIYRIQVDDTQVDRRFLVYFLLSIPGRFQISADARGSSQSMVKISQEHIRSWRIPLPPIDEQRRIVAALHERLKLIDALIAKKEHLVELLDERARSLMTTAVTEGIGGVSAKTAEVRLDRVIREVQRPVRVDPARLYVEIGVRSHGRGIFHKDPVTGAMLDEKKVYWIEPGDLVFNIVFAWERAVAVAGETERGLIGSHRFPCYRAAGDNADMRYLRYLFVSELGFSLLDRNSPGAAGRNRTLDRKALLKEVVPMPPLEAQQAIADRLDRELAVIGAAIARTERSITRLREYRQALITAAVTGQLPLPASPTPPARTTPAAVSLTSEPA